MDIQRHRLPASVKLLYSVGAIGEALFLRGYDYFIFFYFVAVLGMPPIWAGTALLVSTILDAISDPLVGSISDTWKSPRGRRHPLMYLGTIPFALSWYLLLMPPADLDGAGLFGWFLVFSILLRQGFTLFQVPHLALGTEITTDYEERTSVVTWRIASSFVGGYIVIAGFTALCFPESAAYPENGLLDPSGYPKLATAGGVILLLSCAVSALGTQSQAARLPQVSPNVERPSLRRILEEARLAWESPSFRALFIGQLLFVCSFGINEVFGQFVRIYFWGLTSGQLAILTIPGSIGFLAATALSPLVHRRFDKKPAAIVSAVLPSLLAAVLVIGRLAGLVPDNDLIVMPLLFATALLTGICGGVAFVSAGSMMGDVAHEIVTRTKRGATGVLVAGTSFAQKCSSGIAHFVAAAVLQLLDLEQSADSGTLAPEVVRSLGYASLVACVFGIAGALAYSGYRIDRESYAALTRVDPPEPAPLDAASTPAPEPTAGEPRPVSLV